MKLASQYQIKAKPKQQAHRRNYIVKLGAGVPSNSQRKRGISLSHSLTKSTTNHYTQNPHSKPTSPNIQSIQTLNQPNYQTALSSFHTINTIQSCNAQTLKAMHPNHHQLNYAEQHLFQGHRKQTSNNTETFSSMTNQLYQVKSVQNLNKNDASILNNKALMEQIKYINPIQGESSSASRRNTFQNKNMNVIKIQQQIFIPTKKIIERPNHIICNKPTTDHLPSELTRKPSINLKYHQIPFRSNSRNSSNAYLYNLQEEKFKGITNNNACKPYVQSNIIFQVRSCSKIPEVQFVRTQKQMMMSASNKYQCKDRSPKKQLYHTKDTKVSEKLEVSQDDPYNLFLSKTSKRSTQQEKYASSVKHDHCNPSPLREIKICEKESPAFNQSLASSNQLLLNSRSARKSLWDANCTESILTIKQTAQIQIHQSIITKDYFHPETDKFTN